MFAKLFRWEMGKNLFRLALWGAGLASISMMIWTLGPLIDIGGYRPFENYLIRDAIILIATAAFAGAAGLQVHPRSKTAQQLTASNGAAPPTETADGPLQSNIKEPPANLTK